MLSQVKPVSCKELVAALNHSVPDVVVLLINELLSNKFKGSFTEIGREEIENGLKGKMVDMDKLFEKDALNIRELYSEAGFLVEYHPSYGGSFSFSQRSPVEDGH